MASLSQAVGGPRPPATGIADPALHCAIILQGPIHTALTVAREEGVMKLWSGATATTIRQGRCESRGGRST